MFKKWTYLYHTLLKFIVYSEKATKSCEIFTFLLSVCTVDKSMVKISQNFVAFSEYMDFTLKRSRKNAIHISELFDIMAVGTGPSSRFWQISKPYNPMPTNSVIVQRILRPSAGYDGVTFKR